ncbi:MAG: hypothetical protein LBJ91_03540 [Clostridiales Family XIII bacterium]|jgi:hypothetical protein|nr:hypothetical protein [Clostridiales Family XIII bacterium]
MDIYENYFGFTNDEIEANRVDALSWKDSNHPVAANPDISIERDSFSATLISGVTLLLEDKENTT